MTRLRLIASIALFAAGTASAQPDAPVAVSPGSAGAADVVASICPTFNWGHGAKVDRFEIAVHRAGDERADALFVRELPGTATGWTPSLELCFTPGDRYAWRVRAVDATGASAWSAPSFFRVAPDTASMPREQAIAVVNEMLAAQRRSAPAARPDAPAVAAPKGAAAQLEVAGGVLGTSFAGDGSALTNVDAATLDGVDGTGYTASGQSCPAGSYVSGIDATGSIVCAGLAAYVNQSCFLYLGWRDACDGCTTAPVKWGRTSANACENGAGVNNTCQSPTLGAEAVTLFGLNFDGTVDDNDKVYVGLKCL